MLILASASPRRQELLRNAGIPFTVQPADIDEKLRLNESPRRPQGYVLGADTIVVVDDMILGKPRDENDAKRMLRLLSGRTHAAITGVCLVGLVTHDTGESRTEMTTASETTRVTMCQISDNEIGRGVCDPRRRLALDLAH